MELNNFARIGKGVLTKAIGLQKNYVEEYVQVSNSVIVEQSGCYSCPVFQAKKFLQENMISAPAGKLDEMCCSCSDAVVAPKYKIQYRYINEKNKYGYQPTLKSNAIKLLLLYHFLQPDQNGFVKNVNIKAVAERIGCTFATVLSCNKILSDYGYCYFSESGIADKHINIYLPEYKSYHKPASEGGRGYLTFSQEMMNEILHISSLNTLRLTIKGLLEVDLAQLREGNLASASSDYSRLRGFLPSYCKRNVIRKALSTKSRLLNCTFSDKGVVFSVGSSFAQKQLRSKLLQETQSLFEEYVDQINNLFETASNDSVLEDVDVAKEILCSQGIANSDYYPPLVIKKDGYSSVASMILQYNLPIVRSAVIDIYNRYILRSLPIDNFGALVRTFIRSKIGLAA